VTPSNIPVQVSGVAGAYAISSGAHFNCVIISGKTVKCWGYNYNGQLGNGAFGYFLSPVRVKYIGP
jgi:alpha-tubulin suppressor-like RCC1 family protein